MPLIRRAANIQPNRRCRTCLQYIPGQAAACLYCGHFQSRWRAGFRAYGFPLTLAVFTVVFPSVLTHQIQAVAQRTYNDQLIVGLKVELSQNWATIENARKILESDLQLLTANKFNLTPLVDFRFEAWEQAKSGPGNFLEHLGRTDTAGFMKLTNCYTALRILQKNFENRENYRYLHEGKPQFVEKMKKLDNKILSTLNKGQKLITTAQTYLYSIHNWRVVGESFSIDTGQVITESEMSEIVRNTPGDEAGK